MKKKHQVHNLIILDESGSMQSIKELIISGFNELVQTIQGIEKQFSDQEHFISFLSFNGLCIKTHHFAESVTKLVQLDDSQYNPNASTPLYNALGFGINKLDQYQQDQKDYNVLVTILTDGEENASKEFSGNDIKQRVEAMKLKRWTFTYIGTDHDVERVAEALSINNTMYFPKSKVGIQKMFFFEGRSRLAFSEKIDANEDEESGYFENDSSDMSSF
jgi:hypothetical protein